MKKPFIAILAFVYLSTSVGATIHFHYCMGKLIAWGLVNHETKNCNYCGMPKSSGNQDNWEFQKNCCKDEHKQVKNDKDQKPAQVELQVNKLIPDPLIHLQDLAGLKVYPLIIAHPSAHAPPIIGHEPIFLLCCNFRI